MFAQFDSRGGGVQSFFFVLDQYSAVCDRTKHTCM